MRPSTRRSVGDAVRRLTPVLDQPARASLLQEAVRSADFETLPAATDGAATTVLDSCRFPLLEIEAERINAAAPTPPWWLP